MNSFIKQKILLEETLSDQLRTKRKKQGISLKEVASELKINVQYLEAMENNQLEKLPTGVYSKNFLKKYALFLNIDTKNFDNLLDGDDVSYQKKLRKNLFSKKIPEKHYFLCIPKIIKNIIIILIVLSFLVYLGFFINNIISPPKLFISYPEKDLTTDKKFIEITGITEQEVQIYINEDLVLVDVYGSFSKRISLKEGLNLISITAQKKYSKKNEIIRKILVN
ncbi:hypothetical protein A2331_00270 [Candidatus Falkowbacteria bacterium RIFOXYB2_FULL_34_18]|uniref:HTH cro/C1-type domain-containing protein n=1 Tax=Candidatus Falkowbacteria bacterium RIFOXYD2_FULL_34_120 TaxID=1798007 RepID=A0A1F5TNT6_9BACT|nr:MAG: hypothetical protein A2331_00270 [Candidatus Falkowbacteria bacterium RIFOXYB2_FULL_34_18]OGF29019.1 MAG: hypothetical protein A2500_02695 [Candidatus Falkowbacteria bacterium RIFOXYC12_FULL_34_55]OGF35964.1 MAG: hypothetical protein A2466_01630 [Candidatus Falkowbacteria bacterium RIFOXYC2_FULL_34_220]OGF38510.1 MAG: hypothetical protein A2515_07155 [Candidatus Falkowbacteria bacterium RIFOXYD12_FULL_34_57]OGF40672.1 MAG: hypothetical protein A2531_03375 [Candidatus Falkowbacteria bact